MDFIAVFTFLIATGSVVSVAGIFSTLLDIDSRPEWWLSTLILTSGIIVVLELILGILHLLTAPILLTASLGLLGITLLISSRMDANLRPLAHFREDLANLQNVLFQSKLTILLTILLGGQVIWLLAIVLIFPPWSWDALAYHLPPVIGYIHADGFTLVKYSVYANTYPKNIELHFLWNIIFLRDDVIVEGTQLFFAAMSGLAVYILAVERRLTNENALIAATGFIFAPIVLTQSVVAYVDLAFGALILASFVFLIRYTKEPTLRYVLLLGVSTGVMIGSKFTGGVFYLLVSTAFMGAWYFSHNPRHELYAMAHLVVFVGISTLIGGYWYLRNWVVFGNPVYPFGIEILGREIFYGPNSIHGKVLNAWQLVEPYHGPFNATTTLEKLYLSWYEKVPFYSHGYAIGGYGPLWGILALPTFAFYVYDTASNRRMSNLALIVLFVLPLIVTVEPWKARYNIYILGFAGFLIAYARQHVAVESRTLFTFVFIAILLFSVSMTAGLNGIKYPHMVNNAEDNPGGEWNSITVRQTLSPVSAENFSRVIPPGSKIGFVLADRDMPYLLYGDRFQNKITGLSDIGDDTTLKNIVRVNNLEYLILYKLSEQAKWAQNASYVKVHENTKYLIYKTTDD